ncbi:MAG: hypothetical protein H0W50_04790 [Parachlamydiaceae bacterium]|nr:hypothetical protein [Parachlamydiaceae bacterium]
MIVNTFAKALAFWNPAINHFAINQKTIGRFNIDQTVLVVRRIALYALGVVGAVFALQSSIYLFTGCCVVLLLCYKGKYIERFEKLRALKVLDRLAVNFFKSFGDVPVDAMIYASSSPSVVKSLLSVKGLIGKTNAKFKLNISFLVLQSVGLQPKVPAVLDFSFKKVLKRRKNGSVATQIIPENHVKHNAIDEAYICGEIRNGADTSFDVLKVLIDSGTFKKGKTNNLHRVTLLNHREFAFYAIEKGALEPSDFMENDLIDLWSKIHDEEMIRLFRKKGFSIDFADNFGRTPLIQAIAEMNLQKISFLIEHGATLPQGDEIINIIEVDLNNNLQDIKQTVNEFLFDKEDIRSGLYRSAFNFGFWQRESSRD